MIGIDTDVDEIAPDVVGLMFHPDLIKKTSLSNKIKDYSFFDYAQREALHLSAEERRIFNQCLDRIKEELNNTVDKHTAVIVSSQIQVLLDYMTRFYERQFITRREVNSDILSRFENSLKQYLETDRTKSGLPTVNFFAEEVHLTPGYFGDMIKKETGVTAKEIISRHIVERAKQRLTESTDDISIVAYKLGFKHPQHFSRMFKRITGISPTQYREKAKAK